MELISNTDTRTLAEIEREARRLRAQAIGDMVSALFARIIHGKPATKAGKTVHTPA